MSLLSSIQLAGNSLQAQQLGLQVVGQNIANANTPGYSVETLGLTPGPTQQDGSLLLGTGVDITGVQQQVDQFLNTQVRNGLSTQTGTGVSSQTYQQLESMFGILNDTNNGTNLDSAMTNFFSSVSQILNNPNDPTVQQLAVSNGQTVATTFNQLASSAQQLQTGLNGQVQSDATTVNTLLTQIGTLNQQIVQLQGGTGGAGSVGNQAVGLLDQRDEALSNLAGLMNVSTQLQPDGTVTVYNSGQYLVDESQVRPVTIVNSADGDFDASNLALQGSNTPLTITSGQIGGLINSRDQILGGFVEQLNSLANTFASAFNQLYSTGQGSNGYTSVTGTTSVADPSAPLDSAGLSVTPANGTFQVLVYDSATGLTQTSQIEINENGLSNDTTLNSLAGQLNGVSGLAASVNSSGQLQISTTSPTQQVAFAGDTSGALSALGINTFFTGTTAATLGVNSAVANQPTTFAASAGGIGVDTQVAQQLANFANLPLLSAGGATISDAYNSLAANVTQGSSAAQAAASAASTYQTSLQSQQQSISGVSLDTQTVDMLQYQAAYSASAKYISEIDSLLQTLMQL
ncbi:MAG TPA: flagellar hook-associated protein FlgK [Pirellulales bacterium]|jgi:flagellar hook-associated protein 1 FlgK|nr:flagellar hook-associated protein FlgK [Pirellulales bacterium]